MLQPTAEAQLEGPVKKTRKQVEQRKTYIYEKERSLVVSEGLRAVGKFVKGGWHGGWPWHSSSRFAMIIIVLAQCNVVLNFSYSFIIRY